jgi:hypothetical protein
VKPSYWHPTCSTGFENPREEVAMLVQIIRQFREFQRVHNQCPNVVYLNSEHYTSLRKQYPELFSDETHPDVIIPLKITVVLVPKEYLSHPRVACILPGSSRIFNCKSRPVLDRRYKLQAEGSASYRKAYA